MKKVIKVPLQKYITTLIVVAAHVILLALLAKNFVPTFNLNFIILIGLGFYVFKVVNYMFVSIEMKENSFVYNGIIKRGTSIPFGAIQEIELEGPSQFNSNYMLALYGEKSNYEKRLVLRRIPIYWFSRNEIVQLLNSIKENNPFAQFQKQVSLYLTGQYWKTLLINYLIQYALLVVIIIFILKKYS